LLQSGIGDRPGFGHEHWERRFFVLRQSGNGEHPGLRHEHWDKRFPILLLFRIALRCWYNAVPVLTWNVRPNSYADYCESNIISNNTNIIPNIVSNSIANRIPYIITNIISSSITNIITYS
jgi:hypothetical protein